MKFHMLNKYKILQILILTVIIISFSYGFYLLNTQYLKNDNNKTNINAGAIPTVTPVHTPTINSKTNENSKKVDESVSTQTSTNEQAALNTSNKVQDSTQNISKEIVEEKTVQSTPIPNQTPAAEEKNIVPAGVQNVVEEKASTIVSKPVSSGDFVTAASTILGKLSVTEMMYIFNSARDDFWVVTPVDEINNIRSILFSKLTDEDLNTLISLGKKYGRSMAIIDKNIDVEKVKEKQVELAKAKEQK